MQTWLRSVVLVLLVARAAFGAAPTIYPIYPTSETGFTSGAALHLACGRFVAVSARTGATKLAVNIKTGYGGGVLGGWALYPDDDALPPLASVGAVDVSLAGIKTATGLTPFSTSGGTTYRACFCATANSGTYFAPKWTATTGTAALMNAFSAVVGRASNDCDASANPPASTGAIAADPSLAPPLFNVE